MIGSKDCSQAEVLGTCGASCLDGCEEKVSISPRICSVSVAAKASKVLLTGGSSRQTGKLMQSLLQHIIVMQAHLSLCNGHAGAACAACARLGLMPSPSPTFVTPQRPCRCCGCGMRTVREFEQPRRPTKGKSAAAPRPTSPKLCAAHHLLLKPISSCSASVTTTSICKMGSRTAMQCKSFPGCHQVE